MRSTRSLRVAAVVVTSLLLVAGIVRAASSGYQQRQAAAFEAAMAKRKALGLDKSGGFDKLRRQYPTPEVTLGGVAAREAKAVRVCAGDTAKLFLGGTFQPGTTFIVQSDDATVLNEKLTPKGWEASIKLPKDLPPVDIHVMVAAPVSFISATVHALTVRCSLRFKLKLDSGPTLDAALKWQEDATEFQGPGTWTPGGPVKLSGRTSGGRFTLEQQPSEEDLAASTGKMQAAMESPAMQALEKRQARVMEQMNACMKKPPAKMEACLAGPSKETEAIASQREALLAAGIAPAVGCMSMSLLLKQGKVEGTASGCSDGKEHQVTGTFASP